MLKIALNTVFIHPESLKSIILKSIITFNFQKKSFVLFFFVHFMLLLLQKN